MSDFKYLKVTNKEDAIITIIRLRFLGYGAEFVVRGPGDVYEKVASHLRELVTSSQFPIFILIHITNLAIIHIMGTEEARKHYFPNLKGWSFYEEITFEELTE